MKRPIVAVAVLALVSVVLAGPVADAANGPTLAQFRQLKRQVTQLERATQRLESRVETLEEAPTDACLSTINVAQFDDYLADDGFTSITGLDIDNVDPHWQVVIRTC